MFDGDKNRKNDIKIRRKRVLTKGLVTSKVNNRNLKFLIIQVFHYIRVTTEIIF